MLVAFKANEKTGGLFFCREAQQDNYEEYMQYYNTFILKTSHCRLGILNCLNLGYRTVAEKCRLDIEKDAGGKADAAKTNLVMRLCGAMI